jgi:hypothetical protein
VKAVNQLTYAAVDSKLHIIQLVSSSICCIYGEAPVWTLLQRVLLVCSAALHAARATLLWAGALGGRCHLC